VAVFQHACDMQMVVPKEVTAVDQLKGKSVAVITKASVNGICTVADLRNHGLQPDKDYKLIETGAAGTYAAMVAAIDAHHVDGGAMQPNFAGKLSAGGQFHILYDLATEPNLKEAASSLTFSQPFIQARPADVQKTLDALLQGEDYFAKNKAQAQEVLKSTFKITDQAQLDESYARLTQLLAKDVTPTPDLFPDIVAALSQVQPNIKTLDLSTLLNPTFAQDAAKRGLAG
jgi:ABC-type nitrate/sulfonate/bicarbonate transport system substrate-binding protein